jgi:hypothetical protein
VRHFVHAGTPILRIVNQNHRSQFDEGRATSYAARTPLEQSFNGKVDEHSRTPWGQKIRGDGRIRTPDLMHARAKCEANALPTAPRPRLQSRSEFDIFYINGFVVKIDLFRYPTGCSIQ